MSSFNYLIPTIYDAPDGYDVTVAVAPDHIARRLAKQTGEVMWDIKVFHDGRAIEEERRALMFKPDKMPTEQELIYVWRGSKFNGSGRPAFVESTFSVSNDRGHFTTKASVGNYGLYAAPNRPSYRADGDYKFGSPPVISTVSMLGRVVDGYPVIRLDRSQGFGESLACINPYGRQINVSIRSHDGRELPRQRVGAFAGLLISLEPLLKPEEQRWTGRIQITANNRLLMFHLRHKFGDARNITDHEHLDPYRADPTHLPATKWLRQSVGQFAKRFGVEL